MDSYQIKKAYQEQHYDRLLQEAAKNRMLSEARGKRHSLAEEKEVSVMLRRRLVYATAILIALALLTAMTVAAAGFGGGGGGGAYLVM